jgi:hypothetical protein
VNSAVQLQELVVDVIGQAAIDVGVKVKKRDRS